MKENEFLFDKKEENLNMSESMINFEDYKNKSMKPDKREKYDIYVPMIKDDGNDEEEEEDFISTQKTSDYKHIMTNLKNDIFFL